MSKWPIDLSNIRLIKRNQSDSFEELCYQITKFESDKKEEKVRRVKAPDGGVEFYKKLPGLMIGYQCKYFFTLEKSQKAQIRDSFLQALSMYPNVKQYFVFIPFSLNISQYKKWDGLVNELCIKAKRKNRNIKIDLLDESFIVDRIIAIPGIKNFWFGKEEINLPWFKTKLDEKRSFVGPRYTPELNVKSSTFQVLDYFSRGNTLYMEIKNLAEKIDEEYLYIESRLKKDNLKIETYPKLRETIRTIYSIRKRNKFKKIEFESLINLIDKVILELRKASEVNKQWQGRSGPFRSFLYSLEDLKNWVIDEHINFANNSILILTGEAGIGKTHDLFDFAYRQLDKENPVIVLLGRQFFNGNLWKQILESLLISNMNRDEFLDTLNQYAITLNKKIFFIIDALNETEDKNFWSNNLKQFLEPLKKYSTIKVILSVRKRHEKYLFDDVSKRELLSYFFQHAGLGDSQFDAIRNYFEYYHIKYKIVNNLLPGLNNPLFLKIFCQAVKDETIQPYRIIGLTEILKKFVEKIHQVLWTKLDYDEHDNLIDKSVSILLDEMIVTKKMFVPYERAMGLINDLLPSSGFHDSLFNQLLSNNVIIEDFYISDNKDDLIIQFPYEKLSDTLMVVHMLSKLGINNNVIKTTQMKKLLDWVKDIEQTKRIDILDSLCIIFPEVTTFELYEKYSGEYALYVTNEGFVDSLSWRNLESIKNETKNHLLQLVTNSDQISIEMLASLSNLFFIPNHPLNVNMLHEVMTNMDLPKRDYWWTIPISNNFFWQNKFIDRILKLKIEKKDNKPQIILYALMLSWCLSSTNRMVRDHCTKRLLSLSIKSPSIIASLLKTFVNINDPYILERLFAISYGICLRTSKNNVNILTRIIYKIFREAVNPIVNIMIIDYLTGILFQYYRICKNDLIKFTESSQKLLKPFPELMESIDSIGGMPSEDKTWILHNSIVGMGDFGRHILRSSNGANMDRIEYDGGKASRWVYKRTLEYGWNGDLFLEFDTSVINGRTRMGRFEHDRVGKKYQWIALYEIYHILICNGFKIKDYNDNSFFYSSSQLYLRNIDPSVVKYHKDGRHENILQNKNKIYEGDEIIARSANSIDWTTELLKIIKVKYENKEWLLLDGHYQMRSINSSEVFYNIASFTLPKKYRNNLRSEIKSKNIDTNTRIESKDISQAFIYEIPFSPTFLNECPPYASVKFGNIPVFRTSVNYSWDTELDLSIDDVFSLKLPSTEIMILLDLRFNEYFELLDQDADLVSFNASISTRGKKVLFFSKDKIMKYLKDTNQTLYWTVYGEMIKDGQEQDFSKLIELDRNGFKILDLDNQESTD